MKFAKDVGSILLGAAITFLIVALVLQVTYNFAMPQLVKSVNKNFKKSADFTPINFGTAAVVTILAGILFCCHGASLIVLARK
uniref:Transmembrane protein n=1 Tax=Marseillevirus LCMAC103 TaxID=2506604 RepID=A0A481YVE7_9VIRU|nr:MAG: hypothetical protein LCMAC103_03540 [Marseillevirus LCMAC103]